MSTIYLIRHAQAGSRDNYDVLSELGHEQARQLGRHFAEQGIELSGIVCGGMRRQQHTAELVCEVMSGQGFQVPEPVIDERWNEFSLLSVYRAIAERMMEESPEFERDYREMQDAIRKDPHTTGGATGRCDAAVVRAWMADRYEDYKGERWASFRERIQGCGTRLMTNGFDSNSAIAVFTSATPVAILAAQALGLTDEKLLSILGVIYNSGITLLRHRDQDLRLFTFNSTPHLLTSQRTLR